MYRLEQASQFLWNHALRTGLLAGSEETHIQALQDTLARNPHPRLKLAAVRRPSDIDSLIDESQDFLLFADYAGGFQYVGARDAVTRALPKLRVGGLIGGTGYHDGQIHSIVHGVRTAVGELAALHGLQVAATLDLVPFWWAIKEPSATARRQRPAAKVLVLTAHDGDPAQAEMAAISTPNKQAYCRRHGYDFLLRTDGFDRSRHPIWSRLKFLGESLRKWIGSGGPTSTAW
jgi:hypothetical protein